MGHTTSYTYDADNRRVQETFPDMPSDTRSYSYDATGHLILRLDQNGRTTTYQYNDFYYVTNRQHSAGTNDSYAYDIGGRLTNETEGAWTDTYTYDAANRVLTFRAEWPDCHLLLRHRIRHSSITYPGGQIITEDYDLRSRLMRSMTGVRRC